MKESKKYQFSKEDILKMINTTYGKSFTLEQFSMSSQGAVVNYEQEL